MSRQRAPRPEPTVRIIERCESTPEQRRAVLESPEWKEFTLCLARTALAITRRRLAAEAAAHEAVAG